jgi:type VI secretion system protein ImpG
MAWSKQVQGIQSVQARSVVQRLPMSGPLSFGHGVQVTLELDELGFQGSSAFLMGSVLSHLLSRQASVNSFCETVLRSASRGQIMCFAPHIGAHAVL